MKCQVGWRQVIGGANLCLNEATHRAISTNGSTLCIFQVCEACARSAAPLRYTEDSKYGMLAGDPLWLIWPPLTVQEGQ